MRPLRFLETVRPLQRGYVVMKRMAFGFTKFSFPFVFLKLSPGIDDPLAVIARGWRGHGL